MLRQEVDPRLAYAMTQEELFESNTAPKMDVVEEVVDAKPTAKPTTRRRTTKK